jgi:mono/diheme cytochrome c family protein
MSRRNLRLAAAAVALLAALAAGGLLWQRSTTDSAAAAVIAQGRAVYQDACAACHGANLEGQPDWRSALESGRMPAPPHDASGHTWHHTDAVLLRILREGTAAVVGGGYESDMPGFADVLSEAEMAAVLAYIKSTWPSREAAYQQQLTAQQ